MLDGNLPPHTVSSCGNEQIATSVQCFESDARRFVNLPKGIKSIHQR